MAKGKTLAMLAIGKPRESEEEDGPMDEGDADGEGLEQAMSDLLDAMKQDDPVGMASAFRDAVDLSSM